MPKRPSLSAAAKAIDPVLDSLFQSSFGPVSAPAPSCHVELHERKAPADSEAASDEGNEDDEILSEISEELDDGAEDESGADSSEAEDSSPDSAVVRTQDNLSSKTTKKSSQAVTSEPEPVVKVKRERKRKRKDENDDLEGKYLSKLADELEPEPANKRQKAEGDDADEGSEQDDSQEDRAEIEDMPLHESLTKDAAAGEMEKASRTVFLSNVSMEAVSSKTAKKTLMAHLSSILDADAKPPQKVESIRFRSLAFSDGALPKRAAYITQALMEATTRSANAYVVYSTEGAARKAASELNGTMVLDRHLRVDSVAHPAPVAHRRCVFVGNLGFVDDETVLTKNSDGEMVQKKRTKAPADVEEGLWRTFSAQGKVENVRVVRDPKTRVGKGFAYVQFYDANAVESSLLLDGKKFPPMLPRALRVTRAKDPRKTVLAQERARTKANANGAPKATKYKKKQTPEEQSMAGRAGRLLGKAGAAQSRRPGSRQKHQRNDSNKTPLGEKIKAPEHIIFEGRRASANDGLPKDLKLGKKGKKGGKGKPTNRGARRAAQWRKTQT